MNTINIRAQAFQAIDGLNSGLGVVLCAPCVLGGFSAQVRLTAEDAEGAEDYAEA